jgi:hypothetical protein
MTETKVWVGLPPIPWTTKINPIWWFGNVEGLDPSYEPTWPMWKRKFFWFFRNFMFNFFRFVVGVEDKLLAVTGPAPVFTTCWTECSPPSTGWKWSTIRTDWLWLPFVSYAGTNLTLYLGWLPSGGRLGAKVNYK